MSQHIEWAHAKSEPAQYLSPEDLSDYAAIDSDSANTHAHGLMFGEVALYGAPEELEEWLLDALYLSIAESPKTDATTLRMMRSGLITRDELITYYLQKRN